MAILCITIITFYNTINIIKTNLIKILILPIKKLSFSFYELLAHYFISFYIAEDSHFYNSVIFYPEEGDL